MKTYTYSQLSSAPANQPCMIQIGIAYFFLYGFETIEQLKKDYPDALILIALKLNDHDFLNAKIAFDIGADVVSVSSLASNETIRNVQCIADENHGHVFLHTENLSSDRLEDAEIYGVEFVDHDSTAMTYVSEYMNEYEWMLQRDLNLEASL